MANVVAARAAAKPFGKQEGKQQGRNDSKKKVVKAASPTVVVSPDEEQRAHSLTEGRLEVIKSMDDVAENELLEVIKPVNKIWQPHDVLPHPEDESFIDEVRALQNRAKEIPDEVMLTLVGDMVTEEALPTYMAMLNTLDGTRDETGASETPWARWTRAWTAEENRHGDAMNKYLYLTGRVDMRAVESTIQRLLCAGMNPKTENNPYLGFVYTSFQERATKISHGNTARLAKSAGDDRLSRLCGFISADEGRHEVGYQRIVAELFERDPDGATLAFEDMMRKQVTMPAHLMDDGEHSQRTGRSLFEDFAAVAERLGVYNAEDYCEIIEHLLSRWSLVERRDLGDDAARARDYLVSLPSKIRRVASKASTRRPRRGSGTRESFSWLFGREVDL